MGMASTGIGAIFVCIGAFLDYSDCSPTRGYSEIKTEQVLAALGTMLFCYGGHSAFPTIQHDMRKPSDFSKSAIFGFISIKI